MAIQRQVAVQSRAVRQQRLQPVVQYLQDHRDRIVPAVELAAICGLHGSRENRRRRIREVVEYGREHAGFEICANRDGYWLAEPGEWLQYIAHQKTEAKGTFARVRRQTAAVSERRGGQGKLFEDRAPQW